MRSILAVIPFAVLFSSACDRDVVSPPTQERPARITYAYARVEGSINIKEDPYVGPVRITCPSAAAQGHSQDAWTGWYSFMLRLEQTIASPVETCRLDVGDPVIVSKTVDLATAARPDSVKGVFFNIVVPPDTPQAARMELPISSISAGATHTCAISANARLYCWGKNDQAHLGIGSHVPTTQPVRAATTIGARTVNAARACLLTTTNATYCWSDYFGSKVPAPLANAPVFDRLESSGATTCGRGPDARLYCWGGYLGAWAYNEALLIGGIPSAKDFAIGAYHMCVITLESALYCWGANNFGEVGLPTTGVFDRRNNAVAVLPDYTFATITAGTRFTCALDSAGVAFCWGRNDRGQLGRGHLDTPCFDQYKNAYACPETSTEPRPVTGGLRFKSIVAGASHVCAITHDGTLYCWGEGTDGRLGNGVVRDAQVPVAVYQPGGQLRFKSVTLGPTHTCGVAEDGRAYCWGAGESGALGTGTKNAQVTPALVWGQE